MQTKLTALRGLMADLHLDCLILSRHANAAWLSGGGRTAVNRGTEAGVASIIITKDEAILLTNNIEARRLETEELPGLPLRVVTHPWWAAQPPLETLGAAVHIGSDVPLPGARLIEPELAELRTVLDDQLQQRARRYGQTVGQIMAAAARSVQPGMTEHEIAGQITGAVMARGMDAPVCLVGTDERFFAWRHFLPTAKRLERYACLVVCARAEGLIFSASRLVHFGTPSDEIMRRVNAVQQIDAAVIAATRPGATAGGLFEIIRSAYAAAGFPEEWQNHHQGGLAGYAPREWIATPEGPQTVKAGQLYAWNPTVPGAKSEDTILVGPEANEILTDSGDFPYVDVTAGGATVRRPTILIR